MLVLLISKRCYTLKGDDDVSPKAGQKIKDNPKEIMLRTRIDRETYNKLQETADILKVNKSEVVRSGIESEYQKAKKK